MNPDIFLAYGLDKNKEIVHISQIASGLSKLTCPFCDSHLIAKKGDRLAHHFAHATHTCKTVAKGELDGLAPAIPFYSDFFSSHLTPTERKAICTLYDTFGLELFYRKGKANSAFHVLFLHDIPRLSQVWENLISSGLIRQKGNWYQLTQHAEVGLTQLAISDFAKSQAKILEDFEFFLQGGKDERDILRWKVYQNLKSRLLQATLYCLRIPRSSPDQHVWKIGITTRTAAIRLQELLPVITHHFGEASAQKVHVVKELPGMGRLEAYIKKRFTHSQFPITYKGQLYTEFFTDPQLFQELEAVDL